MKTKHLPVFAMAIFTVLIAAAQEAPFEKPSIKQSIPFGEKLPPPGHTEKVEPGPKIGHLNISDILKLTTNRRDINAIKKTLEDNRQQLKNQKPATSNSSTARQQDGSSKKSGFHLTRDINAMAESNPANYSFIYPYPSFAVLENVIYFAADDGIHGTEFWRSDGTSEGTFMVKDIEPGIFGSSPDNITSLNGKLYFSTITTGYGAEPWVSDGTENGTQLLLDVRPGDTWSFSSQFTAYGSDVYFVADNEFASWGALWKTDGTTAGTKLVRNVGEIGVGGLVAIPVAVNNLLFFTFLNFTSGAWELWRSDGTDAGTYHVGTNVTFYNVPFQLTNYNNKLYFAAGESSLYTLWVSDGTDAGTMPAPGNNGISVDIDGVFGTSFPIMDNVLYMSAGFSSSGKNGLYKYDASNSEGVVLVNDFSTYEYGYIIPVDMEVANNTLYLRTIIGLNGVFHEELWSSNGTSASTHPIDKFLPGETIGNLYNENGNLYFVKYDETYDYELWKILSTSTIIVSDIFKGDAGSYPEFLTAFKGKLFFTATDEISGRELFMTDGIDASIVKDINTFSTQSSYAGYFINTITPLGRDVIFRAYDRIYGHELYKSDGTEQGTLLLNDIFAGEASSGPFNFLSKNNNAYFIARNSNSTLSIYSTKGPNYNLQKNVPDYADIRDFKVANNGLIFYVVYNASNSAYELWRSNGKAGGPILLSSTLSNAYYLNVAGNTAFFVAGDSEHGYELWKSDGSLTGTNLVKDINTGIGHAAPAGMFAFKNQVYFAADNGTNPSFWKSDGTEAGTIQLQNIDPWYSSNVYSTELFYFCVVNDIIYFSAVDVSNTKGTQLWRTDGTIAGTQVVKDTDPGATGYYPVPFYFRNVNGSLFFIENPGPGLPANRLWKSNGTEEGTQLVKDFSQETGTTLLGNLTSLDGKLFFTKNSRLWLSDGTEEGTKPVDDPVINDVDIQRVYATTNQLFLSFATHQYGYELYAGTVDDKTGKFVKINPLKSATNTPGEFNAVLYPNPIVANSTLQITGNTNNISISITDMSGKKIWQLNNSKAKVVTLPTEKYVSGVYLVTVTNGKENKVIKLVKQ